MLRRLRLNTGGVLGEQRVQRGDVHGLHEMGVEPRVTGALAVFVSPGQVF